MVGFTHTAREGKEKQWGTEFVRSVSGRVVVWGTQVKQDGHDQEFEGGGLAGVEKIMDLDGGR